MSDRRTAPHVARNTEPILSVLREVLPARGLVLEIAAGSGQQSVAFARIFSNLLWQPTDGDHEALRSIEAWRAEAGLFNLLPGIRLDAAARGWPIGSAEAIVCINMVHISPWQATTGLMDGAARVLEPGGMLYLYGPYRRAGIETASSNEAFDQSLKARNPEWGLRDLEAVTGEAKARGLALDRVVEMPANNLSVVYRRPSSDLSSG